MNLWDASWKILFLKNTGIMGCCGNAIFWWHLIHLYSAYNFFPTRAKSTTQKPWNELCWGRIFRFLKRSYGLDQLGQNYWRLEVFKNVKYILVAWRASELQLVIFVANPVRPGFLPGTPRRLGFSSLVLLLGQNIFCPGQSWHCPGQNFCPGLETTFFDFESHAKWIFVVDNRFQIRKFCFKWLLKAKSVLFNPGQGFCLGQFQFCPGQKLFCPSRRTRSRFNQSSLHLQNMN